MSDSEEHPKDEQTQPRPKKIGPYEFIRLLGRGGMGEVWLARDKVLHRDVAIKLLRGSILDDRDAARRFLREARTAAQLNHPNGVTIYQVAEKDGRIFIVMELVDGGTLADVLKRGPLPWLEATKAIRDAAAGLAAAHEMGLVHCDIKPSNLMRSERGFVKVVDFGLARAAAATTEVTGAGAVLGTPYYMAPEQGRGKTVDARSDLYSLACTYYTLVVGSPPFRGGSSTAVLFQHVHAPVPDPQKAVPDLPDIVVRVITRGMAKDPGERYQSAAEMIADLDEAIEESVDLGGAQLRGLAKAIRKTGQTTIPAAGRVRGWGTAAIAAFAILAFIGVGSWAAWRYRLSGPTSEPPAKEAPPAPADKPVARPTPMPPDDLSSLYPNWDGKESVADYAKRAGIKEAQIVLKLSPDVSMRLTLIPAGKFMMGSPDGEKDRGNDEGPQHEVMISKPFYMGIYPVTQEQYEQVMGKNPSSFKGAANPVETVSWEDAVEFCKKLSQKTGKSVTLPTEARWEYACRAGSKTRFGSGDDDRDLGDYAWYGKNSNGKTHPVGQKKPNEWGLYDMHGNVWQWCSDWYDEDYYSANANGRDPQGPGSGTRRVLRGGCWGDYPVCCRSAYRNRNSPDYRDVNFGFRVSMDSQ